MLFWFGECLEITALSPKAQRRYRQEGDENAAVQTWTWVSGLRASLVFRNTLHAKPL